MKEKILLLDGSAVIYRSYFAFKNNPLINSRGENTSAIFGFMNTLVSIKKKFDPKYFAVIQDEKAPTFRHKQYPEYKATRDKMPEDLVSQLAPLQELLKAAKVPFFSQAGFEADDIIGTIVSRFSEKFDILILSSDKDLYQLVNDNVQIYRLSKKIFVGPKEVKEKFGVPPAHIIDLLGLMGDSSDNVPGVPKIGMKTAAKLINEFGNIENIIQNSDKITKNSIRKSLQENSDLGTLSKKLVTLDIDVPISISEDEMKFGELFTPELEKFCKRYELNAFSKHFEKKSVEKSEEVSAEIVSEYKLIAKKEDFENLLEELHKQKNIAVDLETNSLNKIDGKIVGISFCYEPKVAYYIPLRHDYGLQLDLNYVLSSLKPLLENKNKFFIGHNIKFDYMIFQNEGIEIANLGFDTMIAAYLLSPDEHRHNLDAVSLKYLEHKMIPISALIGKGKKQLNFTQTAIEAALTYAAEDANITYQLWEILAEKLENQGLFELFKQIEMPLVKVLASMERNGVFVDVKMFKHLSQNLGEKLADLKKKIFELSGEEFNINSPAQLSYILFDKMNLPVIKRTKTGKSTNIDVLEKLSKDHDIASLMIDYRKLAKLKSTYADAFPKLINRGTHRIHSSFNQTVTATGRLSSSNPNLQNIPIRTEIGRGIREGFIAQSEDFTILAADYSQIELRIMALMSEDKNLIKTFQTGGDVHAQTASLIFDIPPDFVTSDQRREAKTINFGILYGMGSYSLSQDLNISREEAKTFKDNYFNHFPKVKEYLEKTKEFAHKNGYVQTLFGRKRFLKYINSRNKNMQKFAERTAINMPIQGTSADIIKIAMSNIYNKIHNKTDEIKMIIQIHDELLFEIRKNFLEKYTEMIKIEMESVLNENHRNIVPIVVDIGHGKNWLEAH
ncbi:MAG: DNA polymerase I [Candidatus Cloacimonadota bacterium]|nr:DNA polymerase I [Candidatus Cloacimonadota bacterium]